jgi:hypothetical protein
MTARAHWSTGKVLVVIQQGDQPHGKAAADIGAPETAAFGDHLAAAIEASITVVREEPSRDSPHRNMSLARASAAQHIQNMLTSIEQAVRIGLRRGSVANWRYCGLGNAVRPIGAVADQVPRSVADRQEP